MRVRPASHLDAAHWALNGVDVEAHRGIHAALEVFEDQEGLAGSVGFVVDDERATITHAFFSDRFKAEGLLSVVARRVSDEAARRGARAIDDAPAILAELRGSELKAQPRPPYMPRWCEENALCFCRASELERAHLVFVTSPSRATPLRLQRASLFPDEPVLWDYHVFVVGDGRAFDLDTTLEFGGALDEYLALTFADAPWVGPAHQPRFRVIPKAELDEVKTDRSHMRAPDGTAFALEPPWAPLSSESNLMEMIEDTPTPGTLMNLDELRDWRP